jgi:hypothetical protein
MHVSTPSSFQQYPSIAGRLTASFTQHRLIRFHALSDKGGLSIRGGRFPLETFFTIWISCTPSKGITPNWICTSISIPRSGQVENKQEHCYPPRNKDSQTHKRPTFAFLSSIGHHRPTLRCPPPLHPNFRVARVRQSCNAVLPDWVTVASECRVKPKSEI